MCGIFGIVPEKGKSNSNLSPLLKDLFILSQSRGKDASGLAIVRDGNIEVLKKACSASQLIESPEYISLTHQTKIQAVIGHARMETNGSFSKSYNNQPVVKDGLVTIHNGIIVNDDTLWENNSQILRKYDVDTEVFNSLLAHKLEKKHDLVSSVRFVTKAIRGSYATATLFKTLDVLLLATNTGSLHILEPEDHSFLIFASEEYFLKYIKKKHFSNIQLRLHQLLPGTAMVIGLNDLKREKFNLSNNEDFNYKPSIKERLINLMDTKEKKEISTPIRSFSSDVKELEKIVWDEYDTNKEKISKLRRCINCILPETMPFIEFDDHEVCNYCRQYEKMTPQGIKSLEEIFDKHRSKEGKPDCIVTFSGGRDSSYGLHFIKKELNMNPVAYSYDWGMLTDLGRRNQAKMTGQLGVEHILISADIQRKRENIRKNVEAWLNAPDLGTVPLFMAGDKQYFYYANLLRKQMGIDLIVLCENPMERTDFKTGFCGISPKIVKGKKFYSLSLSNTLNMAFYYARQYLSNPGYLNSSLIDTIHAFFSYYIIPHDYISFYNYIRWDEKEIENTLLRRYDWETASDTPTTWRIGDGTASFYNYIYFTMAGFSENDTFRSNQVREGDLSRKEALNIAMRDNKPRIDSLIWYSKTIGFDLLRALKSINSADKLY